MMMQEKQQKVSKTLTYLTDASSNSTVFENHRKSLIESYIYIWLDKRSLKVPKEANFGEFFENLKFAVKQCYQTSPF